MSRDSTIDLPLARYRLEFEAETPLHLPEYAGSALRGAFGGALRASACMTKRKTCEGCPLLRTCPYTAIFETPPPDGHVLLKSGRAPNPYVIEPPPWGERSYAPGETLAFGIVLAGRALDQLPLVLWAFHRAFERGVGAGDGRAKLSRVFHIGAEETHVLSGTEDSVREHSRTLPASAAIAEGPLTLEFTTPLRLQENGRALRPQALTPRALLMTLVRRVAFMCEFHGSARLDADFKALARLADTIKDDKELVWRDWTRYSSRQKQKMTLGGVVGRWTLRGELDPFRPYLHLGQWLHVGKETTFGLGRYTLAADTAAHISPHAVCFREHQAQPSATKEENTTPQSA